MFYQIAIVLCCMQFKQIVGNTYPHEGGHVCVGDLGCGFGLLLNSTLGHEVECFLGVPYAHPPIGKRRFKNPEMYDVAYGNDYRDFSVQQEDCAQKDYTTPNHEIRGSEDCLYLNIYRPTQREGKLPVMVFIHGGGFFSGTANRSVYGPEVLLSTGMVMLVTFTYRLGPFGFLSTCDYNMPGNFGLKDQNMVLQFVQKYITHFDGDPNQVTLFGHGAGAAAVQLHMLSPLSRGLFHKAIAMSGSAAAPFADVIRDPLQQVRMLCEQLDMKPEFADSPEKMTKFLMKRKTEDILNAGDIFKEWGIHPLVNYRPSIELPDDGAFLTADPKYLIVSGQHHRVPLMTGIVTNEGSHRGLPIYLNETLREDFNRRFSARSIDLLELPEKARTFINEEAVLKFYFDTASELNEDTYQSFIDSITHRFYYQPFFESLRHFVRHSDPDRSPVFLYRFSYRGEWSFSQVLSNDARNFGACHGDDLLYIFKSSAFYEEKSRTQFVYRSTDFMVMIQMLDAFMHFVDDGLPTKLAKITPCTTRSLEFRKKTCDYWEVRNKGDSYGFSVKREFDMAPVIFWGNIVQLFDWCFY